MNPVSTDCIYFQSMSFCIVFPQRIWNKILKFHKSVFNDGFEPKDLLRFYFSILSPLFSSDLVVTSYSSGLWFWTLLQIISNESDALFFQLFQVNAQIVCFPSFLHFLHQSLIVFCTRVTLPPMGCSRQSSYINLIRNNL